MAEMFDIIKKFIAGVRSYKSHEWQYMEQVPGVTWLVCMQCHLYAQWACIGYHPFYVSFHRRDGYGPWRQAVCDKCEGHGSR
jgi:hypothetical protein